jgi:methyltransferase (TIGR00027 family)
MREAVASLTAQRVAAARAGFHRLAADDGDPCAEARLANDIAASEMEPLSEPMTRYLRARTGFFDRCVVNAIARGARQVVIVGAGYDGRALRYAKPGVRFFEVDHPDTQRDKITRLDRLGLDRHEIVFAAFDLRRPGLAAALTEAGFEPEAPAVMLCEGLLVYLDLPALRRLLDELRALTAPGTRLAVSCSRRGRAASPEHGRFRERVAALGEPARNTLEVDAIHALLGEHRWRTIDLSERATAAGFVVAAPAWEPACGDALPTRGRIGRYLEATMHRFGSETLAAHLADGHGLRDPSLRERDVGVFEVKCADGRRMIARVFPHARPQQAAARDAKLLSDLHDAGFPAERLGQPVTVSRHAGQGVLLTEFVTGRQLASAPSTFRVLGELLGRLHTLGEDWPAPAGGAWHHLVPRGGVPARELAAAQELLAAARPRVSEQDAAAFSTLSELLAGADDCAGLPETLTHPDFVPANAIGAEPVIVDWTGAGRGPRLWSLAFLLWAAGHGRGRCVEATMEGYHRHLRLTDEERERLAATIAARPAVFSAWTFVTGRRSLADAAAGAHETPMQARQIAARALSVN